MKVKNGIEKSIMDFSWNEQKTKTDRLKEFNGLLWGHAKSWNKNVDF